jgi:hypothetical protein
MLSNQEIMVYFQAGPKDFFSTPQNQDQLCSPLNGCRRLFMGGISVWNMKLNTDLHIV